MAVAALSGVYRPQADSQLLIASLIEHGPLVGRRVADLGTGTGVVAIAAAKMGADTVTAFDICPNAIRHARAEVAAADVEVDIRLGSWARAAESAPFDVVVSNPPYVPVSDALDDVELPGWAGPPRAWDGGADGRRVLDPLCAAVPGLLAAGGAFLVVQSEYAGVDETLSRLSGAGLTTRIVATETIPFGPVLFSQVSSLQASGRLQPGRRSECLVVIRAEKP